MDILKSLGHPEELINLFKFKIGGCRTIMPKLDYVSKTSEHLIYCILASRMRKMNLLLKQGSMFISDYGCVGV